MASKTMKSGNAKTWCDKVKKTRRPKPGGVTASTAKMAEGAPGASKKKWVEVKSRPDIMPAALWSGYEAPPGLRPLEDKQSKVVKKLAEGWSPPDPSQPMQAALFCVLPMDAKTTWESYVKHNKIFEVARIGCYTVFTRDGEPCGLTCLKDAEVVPGVHSKGARYAILEVEHRVRYVPAMVTLWLPEIGPDEHICELEEVGVEDVPIAFEHPLEVVAEPVENPQVEEVVAYASIDPIRHGRREMAGLTLLKQVVDAMPAVPLGSLESLFGVCKGRSPRAKASRAGRLAPQGVARGEQKAHVYDPFPFDHLTADLFEWDMRLENALEWVRAVRLPEYQLQLSLERIAEECEASKPNEGETLCVPVGFHQWHPYGAPQILGYNLREWVLQPNPSDRQFEEMRQIASKLSRCGLKHNATNFTQGEFEGIRLNPLRPVLSHIASGIVDGVASAAMSLAAAIRGPELQVARGAEPPPFLPGNNVWIGGKPSDGSAAPELSRHFADDGLWEMGLLEKLRVTLGRRSSLLESNPETLRGVTLTQDTQFYYRVAGPDADIAFDAHKCALDLDRVASVVTTTGEFRLRSRAERVSGHLHWKLASLEPTERPYGRFVKFTLRPEPAPKSLADLAQGSDNAAKIRCLAAALTDIVPLRTRGQFQDLRADSVADKGCTPHLFLDRYRAQQRLIAEVARIGGQPPPVKLA